MNHLQKEGGFYFIQIIENLNLIHKAIINNEYLSLKFSIDSSLDHLQRYIGNIIKLGIYAVPVITMLNNISFQIKTNQYFQFITADGTSLPKKFWLGYIDLSSTGTDSHEFSFNFDNFKTFLTTQIVPTSGFENSLRMKLCKLLS